MGAEPKNYTIELNTTTNEVTEQVIKGRVSIIKHTDDGSTQIETPEEGAEFLVYLKSSGSFDNAAGSERNTLICDENGYAETKDLPYGVYTVHQTKGWEGRELLDDFDVYISKNGEVYRYLINNRLFESYVKVVKKDAETGKTIPLAGAGFQIYDESGNFVTMKYIYPEVTTLDTFYTGANGYLITGAALRKVHACRGAGSVWVCIGFFPGIYGNITRLDNEIEKFSDNLLRCRERLETLKAQLETAKVEAVKEFPQEQELAEKTARLGELNALLDVGKSDKVMLDEEPDEGELEPERKKAVLER